MSEPRIDQRKFTDREIHEILELAVDKEPPGALSINSGLSLAELKAIGREVGIDPARLEDAARTVAQRQQEPAFSAIIGIPMVLRHERIVEGELDRMRPPVVLSAVRRVMGVHGEVAEVGGALEWRTKGGAVQRLVSISTSGGRTTIEGSADLRQAAIGTYVTGVPVAVIVTIMGIAASVGQPISGVEIGGLLLSVSFLPTAYVALRGILRRVFVAESAKIERVVQELAQLTEESAGDIPSSESATRPWTN